MSHDIVAQRHGVDADALRESLRLDEFDHGDWLARYEQYCNATMVARLSRSAFNPLNQVLYLALGVMDEAYCGCSGCGVTLEVTRQQLRDARDLLTRKSFDGMTRERNPADVVFEALKGPGDVLHCNAGADGDVTPERQFIHDCLAYLRESGRESVTIFFG